LAKLPKFGEPDSAGTQPEQGFKLPEFTAPKVQAPKPIKAPTVKAPAVKAPTVKAPAQPSASSATVTPTSFKPTEGPILKPIISAASAVFNILESGLTWERGYQYAQASENNQGLITTDDIRDAAFKNRKINGQKVEILRIENGQPVYNIQPTVVDRNEIDQINERRRQAAMANSTAWQRGEQTIYGGDVKAASGLDTTPGALGISEAQRVGFVEDLILDPLNLLPFNTIGKVAKAGSKATKGAYEATKLASRGEISNNIARLLGNKTDNAGRITTAPTNLSPKLKLETETAQSYITAARDKIDNKYAYKTTMVDDVLDPVASNFAVIGSGIEAGYKALAGTLVRLNMDDFLTAYSKADVTRKGLIRTSVVKDGDIYRVLGGNGQELGRATTRFEARQIAAEKKYGVSAGGTAIKTADDVTRATQAVEQEFAVPAASQEADSVPMPAEVEKNKTLNLLEPYQASDGKWYVYNGNKIVRTKSLEDAENYIQAELYVETEISIGAPTKVGKSWQVRIGDSIYEHRTKGEADAFAKAAASDLVPTPVATSRGQALTDRAPSPLALADMLKVPTKTAEASALKKVLAGLDKVAKTAKGVRPTYSSQVKSRIQDILRNGQNVAEETAALAKLSPKYVSEIDAAIKLDETNPFALYDISPPALQNIIGKLRVVDREGSERSFATILAQHKLWSSKTLDSTSKAAIMGALDGLKKRIVAAKAGNANAAEMKYGLIKAEFGEELADTLRTTGIYGPWADKAAAQKAVASYNAIIDGLVAKSQQVKFSGIEDLIRQSKSGSVVVDEDSLKQIFKLIDPSNNIIVKTEAAADKSTNLYFLNEIFRAEGIQTIEDTQIKLAHFGDFDNLIKATGISDDLLLAQLIKDIRNPEGGQTTEFVVNAVAKESKQAMAERLDSVGNVIRARALEGIADANAETFRKIESFLAGQGVETLDTWGRVVVRSTAEAYDDASQAVIKRTFNQVRERKVFSVISALTRNALQRGGKGLNRQQLMDETILGMNAASDALGLLDIRITSTKLRNDEDFAGAFLKAKESKKKFDFTKDGNFAYLHLGDIFKTFKDTGANDLLLDAFFPPAVAGKKPPTNYLGVQGFSDAARQALELRSKSKAIDVDQLTARILNTGLNTNLYTKSYRDRYQQIARDLAEHLAREDVLEGLSAAHLEKSLGMAQKWIDQAQSVSDDLQNLLYGAWQANLGRGDLTDEARVALLRSHLRKVLYVSDVFRIEGGAIAESAIRSISNMVLRRGAIRTPDGVTDTVALIDDAEAQSMRKIINSLYQYEKPQMAMRPGQVKFADEATKASVTKRLESAKTEYETVMGRVEDQFSSNARVKQEFTKARVSAQAKLDRARLAAVEIGIPTQHYSGNKGWIPSERYNFEAETRLAQRRLLNYQAAKSGIVAREQFIADSRPVRPKVAMLTSKQRKAFLEKENIRLIDAHVEIASGRIKDAEDAVMKLMDNNHYENLGATPDEAAEMYIQASIAKGMVDNTTEFVEHPVDLSEVSELIGSPIYGEAGRVAEGISRGQRFAELGYGPSSRQDVKSIQQTRETMMHKRNASFASVIKAMAVVLENSPPALIDDAFDLIKRGDELPADATPELARAYSLMLRPWEKLINSVEGAITTQRGINGDMLAKAMENMGLTVARGFPSPAGLSVTELPDFFLKLPFGKPQLPAHIAPDSQEGREFLAAFQANRESAGNTGVNPIIFMERLMQATQNVIFQKGLAEDFVARFSYKAEGMTTKQAIDAGYVKMTALFGDDSLLKYMPAPENGGLFPPQLAKQFFSLMREYNQMFNSVSAERLRKPFFENMFTVIGGFKAFQTILMPRHHVTNMLGDMSTAMLRGAVAPGHWGSAARLSTKLAMRRAGINYFVAQQVRNNPDNMEKLFRDMYRVFEGEGRVLEGVEAGRKTTGVVLYEGGKPVRKNLSDDDVTDLFEDWGIFEESIYQEDIQGLVDYVETNGIGGGKAENSKRMAARAREALRIVTKAPGDLTAGYGNISRGAHALKLLQERSWPSLEIAMDTISKEIALFHPTAKSLTSFERQWGRFATTYYTWMRMAHSAVLKMMGENTREIVAVQKVIQEWNREQLGEENRPINIGTSYGGDPNQMPAYYTSTSGVQRISGENLQSLLSPLGIDVPAGLEGKDLQFMFPLMYNDVFNYSKIDFDPYRSLEQEVVTGLFGRAESGMNPGLGGVLGKNISLIGEPAIGLLYDIDPATGKNLNLNTVGDVANFLIGANVPQVKLLNTLQLDPEASAEDKFLAGFRALVGLGLLDPQSEATKKNAQNQFNKRTADNIDSIIRQQGVPKEGTVLRQRLEKVAENILKEQEEKRK
jgi:hypothetical protein